MSERREPLIANSGTIQPVVKSMERILGMEGDPEQEGLGGCPTMKSPEAPDAQCRKASCAKRLPGKGTVTVSDYSFLFNLFNLKKNDRLVAAKGPR